MAPEMCRILKQTLVVLQSLAAGYPSQDQRNAHPQQTNLRGYMHPQSQQDVDV